MVLKVHNSGSAMRGFTLIEVVVSIGIILVVVGTVIANYNGFNNTQTLKQAALTLKNDLRFAQNKALSGEKPTSNCTTLSGYRVTFSGANYSIQAFCTPEGLAGAESTISLPNGISFTSAPTFVLYRVISQGTSLTAETPVTLSGSGRTYTLSLSPGGDVSEVGFD
jgi:prepilin-type N-terminal cleavage/methylation domain-containing protein